MLSHTVMTSHRGRVLSVRAFVLAVVVVALAACSSGNRRGSQPAASSPVQSASPVQSVSPGAPGAVVGALPGSVYYLDPYRLVRLSGGQLTVLPTHAELQSSAVSPDGRQIASIIDNDLVISNPDGSNRRVLRQHIADPGYEPSWSADSTRLLVAEQTDTLGIVRLGIIQVVSGRFTALANTPPGIHFQWSADGRHLVFATGTCQIQVADADGGHVRQVPILGDPDPSRNPQRARSCDPASVSPDGSRLALALHTGNVPDGDIARGLSANAVIDTTTGQTVHLPVTTPIISALYQTNGNLLVRTQGPQHNTLTLLSPTGKILARSDEPATAKSFFLLAYPNA
jgi:TolB protein